MQKRMCSILFSFARKNPYIGYCQGMNFIVYFMLTMQFSDEEIFWLLVCTLENFTPFNYYTNMMGVATDLRVLHHIIKHTYPNQHRKLVSLGVDVSIFMLEWLVCLFTSILPFYVCFLICSCWSLFGICFLWMALLCWLKLRWSYFSTFVALLKELMILVLFYFSCRRVFCLAGEGKEENVYRIRHFY